MKNVLLISVLILISVVSTVFCVSPTVMKLQVDASGSTISDDRYANKVSSGTSGMITGVTSATITVSDKVAAWSFYMDNSANGSYATIVPSLWGTGIKLKDGQSDSEEIDVPSACTFTVSMPVTSTITYTIRTVK